MGRVSSARGCGGWRFSSRALHLPRFFAFKLVPHYMQYHMAVLHAYPT